MKHNNFMGLGLYMDTYWFSGAKLEKHSPA